MRVSFGGVKGCVDDIAYTAGKVGTMATAVHLSKRKEVVMNCNVCTMLP